MRHLLDEILEMEASPAAPSSCGCGCPSCASKRSRPASNEMEMWNEVLDELSPASISSAVAYNHNSAVQLGWGTYLDDIVAKVLRLNYTPDASNFAALVAGWQAANGLTADGKLGKMTWEAMKRILGQKPSGGNAPTPPSPQPSGTYAPWACPVNRPGRATDRCTSPGSLPCPAIPNLMCMKGVGNTPFEYVHEVYKDRQSGLERVKRGQREREQKFVPAVRDALIAFTQNMARFGMPIDTILTLGSLYCRCISDTNRLSNHSYGEAIDVAGVRWKSPQSFSRVADTVIRPANLYDPEQVRLFRRIDACLRLSFPNVIDYHRSDHRDHFHCDLNRDGGQNPKATINFAQEMLGLVLRRTVPITGRMDTATYQALSEFSGMSINDLKNINNLNRVYRALFERIAAGNF